MLLRRISKHVKDQNWFAVALDFFIVVAGILIAFQITNWSEGRQQSKLGDVYLTRLGEDLVAMETYLVDRIDKTNAQHALTVQLLQSASNHEISDETLIKATQKFFTEGWVTPNLSVVDTVFADLSSTGNLNLINENTRKKITTYYDDLEKREKSIRINMDWSLANDSRIIFAHDVYRWDQDMHAATENIDEARAHESILLARDDLARLSSMYYYIENSALNNYRDALDNTRQLTQDISTKRGVK